MSGHKTKLNDRARVLICATRLAIEVYCVHVWSLNHSNY